MKTYHVPIDQTSAKPCKQVGLVEDPIDGFTYAPAGAAEVEERQADLLAEVLADHRVKDDESGGLEASIAQAHPGSPHVTGEEVVKVISAAQKYARG